MMCCIVARTRVSHYYCIGALTPEGENLRLGENEDFPFMGEDCEFEVGDVWDISYRRSRTLIAPHLEDVVVTRSSYQREARHLEPAIRRLCTVWEGGVGSLYDGTLDGPSSSGNMCLSQGGRIPQGSVGFWAPDRDLRYEETEKPQGGMRRAYRCGRYSIPYVGVSRPVRRVRRGTLVRTSLTRWLPRGDDSRPKNCWLQISQVYL